MWNPVSFVDIVVEYLAGTRVNKNGQRASSSQIQSGWTLRYIAENSTVESKQFFESLDAWQRCPAE